MYDRDIIDDMHRARRVIAKLTEYEFVNSIQPEYYGHLIETSRSIAQSALAKYGRQRLRTAIGKTAYEVDQIKRILDITDPVLLASDDYLSDNVTITELWCLATDEYENRAKTPVLSTTEGDYIVFSLGESDGPIACSQPKCKGKAWTILVTVAEHDAMPYKKGGSGALRYVLKHGVGEGCCKKHIPEAK